MGKGVGCGWLQRTVVSKWVRGLASAHSSFKVGKGVGCGWLQRTVVSKWVRGLAVVGFSAQ